VHASKRQSRISREFSEDNLDTNSLPKTSFWARKEGTTGIVFITTAVILGSLALITGWGAVAAWLAGVLASTAKVLFYGVLLWGSGILLANRRFRKLLGYMFKSGMRKLTSLWAETDPIGMMRGYISEVVEKLDVIVKNLKKLRGEIRNILAEISRNEEEKRAALEEAQAARQSTKIDPVDRDRVMSLNANKVLRLDNANKELIPLANNMELLYRLLDATRRESEYVRDDLINEVDVEDRKRRAMKAAYSVWKNGWSILAGDDVGAELYDQAREASRREYEMKIGEIQSINDMASGIISSGTLRTEMASLRLKEMLDKLENREGALVLPPGQVQVLKTQTANPAEILDLETPVQVSAPRSQDTGSSERYERLFRTDK
jgi:hypothetical protein